jgi:hypothetical protein
MPLTLLALAAFRRSRRVILLASLSLIFFCDRTVHAAEVGPWGAVAKLRDDTGTHVASKPSGGWYVTPIHAVLQPRSGKVILTGTKRIGQQGCDGSTQRSHGISFVLDPAELDAIDDGATVLVQPIDEAPRENDERHVLYCSGHVPLADGRVFYMGGTDYPRGLPITSPELGLDYGRVFDPETQTFTRVDAPMKGGPDESPGMKWYPTGRLLPDGRVLIAGGYHWSGGGPGDRENRSLEIFDPAAWDTDRSADPYTVQSQPADIEDAINQGGRAYTHVFLLPKPVPAAEAGGLARTVALIGNLGEMWLYNHEAGPSAEQRLIRMPNTRLPNPSAADKAEGSTSLMLPDGRVMIMSGGRDGPGAAVAYFYDPYQDQWQTLGLGIARTFSIATWLPDGTVLLLNGYTNEVGSPWALENAPGGEDGVRRPQIIDPFAQTVKTEEPWPEPTGRGYHSVALLLKDGRVLVAGGKDNVHDTGCEKNEARIYSPPYMSAGPRPELMNVQDGQEIVIGGPPISIEFSGSVRAERGVALLAPGAVTHSYNQSQHYLPLKIVSGPENGSISVAPPSTINEAPPGEYLLHVVSEEGVPSVGAYVRLVAPPACVYPVDAAAGVFIEAEGSSRHAGPFAQVAEPERGNQNFVQVDPGASPSESVPDEGNVMWYDLEVTNGGSTYLWLLGNGPSTASDTVFVSLNGGPDQIVTLTPSAWGWVRAQTALPLENGVQTLKIKAAKPGAQLDRIWLTSDASAAAPSGLGDAAPETPCSKGQGFQAPPGGGAGMGGTAGMAAGAGGLMPPNGGGAAGASAGGNEAAANDAGSDQGCGCKLVVEPRKSLGYWLGLLLVLAMARARRSGVR